MDRLPASRWCSQPAFPASYQPAACRPHLGASWAHLEMFGLIECRFTLQK